LNLEYKTIEPPAFISMHNFVGDMQGCGHIRMIFPALLMNHLRIQGYNFYSSYGNTFVNDPAFYKNYTMIVFQRAATDRHLKLINYFVTNLKPIVKVPIVYEIDDLLVDIPRWNRAYEYYEKYADSIEKIMRLASGITVSTNKLKEIYSKFNENITVIPNHLPKFLWGDILYKGGNRNLKPRILYQGSDNHFCTKRMAEKGGNTGGDFGNTLIDYIRKTTDKYQWVFMGGYPLELDDLKNNGTIEYHGWHNILEYPSYIKKLNIDLCLAPLQQNIFNESKSNIKNLEYVALGVPAIYTDIEPYKHTTNKVKTDEEMISLIEKIIDNPDFGLGTWRADYEVVEDQLFWEDNDNVYRYINSYLGLFKKRLKDA
jgi:O-antigen biosynthesis protein